MRKIAVLFLCITILFTACDASPLGRYLELEGAEAEVEFTIAGRSWITFNTSQIGITDGVVTRGNLSSTYTEYGIEGFAGADEETKGYFLPLEILTEGIDDTADIKAVFMGHEVKADIIQSGESYYAVINMTDDGTLIFDGECMVITITADGTKYGTELVFKQRRSSEGSGLVLNPVIVHAGQS